MITEHFEVLISKYACTMYFKCAYCQVFARGQEGVCEWITKYRMMAYESIDEVMMR